MRNVQLLRINGFAIRRPTTNKIDQNEGIVYDLDGYTIKKMSYAQYKNPIINWQNAIYVPGSDKAIYMSDPCGWYASYKNEQLIGSISSLKKANGTSWLGYYCIKDGYRGHGYGIRMFNHILERDQSSGIKFHTLICQESLVPMYEKINFHAYTYDTVFCVNKDIKHNIPYIKMTPYVLDEILFQKISEYDKAVHKNLNRESFLYYWFLKKSTDIIVAMEDDKVVGINVLSDFIYPNNESDKSCQRMAPLYANNSAIAEKLIFAGIQAATSNLVYLDADGNNTQARSLISDLKIFSKVISLARMSTPELPDYYDTEKVFSPVFYGNGP